MLLQKLKFYGYVSSVLFSYVFADVHFLHLGKVKMRFLHITLFVYRKYILNNSGCMGVSILLATIFGRVISANMLIGIIGL